jgi:hypothetical protein
MSIIIIQKLTREKKPQYLRGTAIHQSQWPDRETGLQLKDLLTNFARDFRQCQCHEPLRGCASHLRLTPEHRQGFVGPRETVQEGTQSVGRSEGNVDAHSGQKAEGSGGQEAGCQATAHVGLAADRGVQAYDSIFAARSGRAPGNNAPVAFGWLAIIHFTRWYFAAGLR